mgnify:CR=1 FL=1
MENKTMKRAIVVDSSKDGLRNGDVVTVVKTDYNTSLIYKAGLDGHDGVHYGNTPKICENHECWWVSRSSLEVLSERHAIVDFMVENHKGAENAVLRSELIERFNIKERELRMVFSKQNKDKGDMVKISWNQKGVFVVNNADELHNEYLKERKKLIDSAQKISAYKHSLNNYDQAQFDLETPGQIVGDE